MDHQRTARPNITDRRRPRPGPLLLAALLALVAVLATGCASDSDSGTVTPQDAPGPATDLTIKVTDGKTTTWSLTCDPAGGDHPDASAACATLEKSGTQALGTPATDQMCTQIFGGEQTATITGTWKGKAVNASLSRKDGCEVARWDQLDPLLPKTSGAQAR
ncbi:SSI family serine proteinase inhibitor [Kineosporia mesophila]|uniref:SSI family serine proteinase inhibitor n=1 Tax=Kineosporia mesophila TaxID=566012 RepID=A0ABP6ZKX5_9ACTN|nr:subtilase-type protease inhibitor [Kineosporia mesophila]